MEVIGIDFARPGSDKTVIRNMKTGQISELCGACQQWGSNPDIENGICTTCDRTGEQIIKAHQMLNVE